MNHVRPGYTKLLNGADADISKVTMTMCFLIDATLLAQVINQITELWWGLLRQHHAQYWISVFQDLKDLDTFSGDKDLIQFTCLEITELSLSTFWFN